MIILAVHHLFFSSPFIGGVLDLLEREKIAQRRFPECVLAQAIDFSWALVLLGMDWIKSKSNWILALRLSWI